MIIFLMDLFYVSVLDVYTYTNSKNVLLMKK